MVGAFQERIIRFLANHPSVTATRLGEEALRDPAFVGNIRNGRMPRLDTAEKVIRWMDEYEREAAAAAAASAADAGPAAAA